MRRKSEFGRSRSRSHSFLCRGGRIRTCDPLLPKHRLWEDYLYSIHRDKEKEKDKEQEVDKIKEQEQDKDKNKERELEQNYTKPWFDDDSPPIEEPIMSNKNISTNV